jgi:hypothetical protein
MIDFILLNSIYVVWLVVPLVPSVLLYWMFPTSLTNTEWNVSGVMVKASGAAGLYLAIIGLSYLKFLSPSLDYVKSMRPPYWTVEAPVTFLDVDKKDVIPKTKAEQFNVDPFAHGFTKIGQKSYLVTLKFSETSDGKLPNEIRLIFPEEGEGFIPLKKLRTAQNTDFMSKKIDLRNETPFIVAPVLSGGQNKAAVAGLPKTSPGRIFCAGVVVAGGEGCPARPTGVASAARIHGRYSGRGSLESLGFSRTRPAKGRRTRP